MRDFGMERDALIDGLVRSGDRVVSMLGDALRSLVEHDTAAAEAVILSDDHVDTTFAEVQDRVVEAMSLVAADVTDRRLLASLLHVNIHLERMGDYAVNIARAGLRTTGAPRDADLTGQLEEMGRLAADVSRTAIRSFARLDIDAAHRLPVMDDEVDRLNLGVFGRLVELAAADQERLSWATHMILVARQVERYADHAVDIGEAAIYAATGEVLELSSNTLREPNDS